MKKRIFASVLSIVMSFGLVSCMDIPELEEEAQSSIPEKSSLYTDTKKTSTNKYTIAENEINTNQAAFSASKKNKSEKTSAAVSKKSAGNEKTYVGEENREKATKESLDFGGKTVTFVCDRSDENAEYLLKILDGENKAEIEEKFNVKIEVLDKKVNLEAEMLSVDSADGHFYLSSSESSDIISMARKGQLAFFAEEENENEDADIYNINGKKYTLDIGFTRTACTLIYNKNHINSVGYDVTGLITENKWNWEKVTEIAKSTTLKTQSGQVKRYGIGMDEIGIKALVLSNGGRLIYPDSEGKFSSYLNNTVTKEALKLADSWFNGEKIASTFSKSGYNSGVNALKNGKISMYFGTESAVTEIFESSKNEFGIAYIPKGPQSREYVSYIADRYSLVVPSVYQNIAEELKLLANSLYEEEYEKRIESEFNAYWQKLLKSGEDFSLWKSLHFGTETVKSWEGSDFVSLAGENKSSIGLEAIVNGTETAENYVKENQPVFESNAEILAKNLQYTGDMVDKIETEEKTQPE